MQLLLLFLILSMQGGGLKEIKPLLEDIGGDNIKTALGEAEQIVEVLQVAQAFMPQKTSAENFQAEAEIFPPQSEINGTENEIKSVEPEKISPFAEVSAIADPEIIAALTACLGE